VGHTSSKSATRNYYDGPVVVTVSLSVIGADYPLESFAEFDRINKKGDILG
jgi:hypothetical protein